MFDPVESGVLGPHEGSIKYVNNNGVLETYIWDSGEWVLSKRLDSHLEGVEVRGAKTQTECSHADARVVYSACGVDLIACECGYEGKR